MVGYRASQREGETMSILDSFVFLLKADSKQAVKGIQDTGEEFDELKKKGEKTADDVEKRFGEFGHKMDGLASKIREAFSGKMAGGFAAVGASLGLATVSALGFSEAMERIPELFQRVQDAATVGVDIEQYDAMTRVFAANGAEADDFRDSMIDLNEAMGEAAADAKSQKAESFKTFDITFSPPGTCLMASTILSFSLVPIELNRLTSQFHNSVNTCLVSATILSQTFCMKSLKSCNAFSGLFHMSEKNCIKPLAIVRRPSSTSFNPLCFSANSPMTELPPV